MDDKKTPANCPVVRINWSDITDPDDWNEEADNSECQFTTVGFLICDTPTRIITARTYDWHKEEFIERTIFPKHPPEIEYLSKQGTPGSAEPPAPGPRGRRRR